MPFVEFTNADTAKSAFMNSQAQFGVDPTASMDAFGLLFAQAANAASGIPATRGGTGFAGTGTLNRQAISTEGDIIVTRYLIDLTGLSSSTTDLDIIGVGATPASFAAITGANGVILGGRVTCLEAPAGGVTDIDIYKATVSTGVFDGAVTSLTGQAAVLTAGGAWSLGTTRFIGADSIASGDFLYMVGGAAGTAAPYTAGRLLVELFANNA
jgi:hypothetical protein